MHIDVCLIQFLHSMMLHRLFLLQSRNHSVIKLLLYSNSAQSIYLLVSQACELLLHVRVTATGD
jgi:hypothetical protein